MEKDYKARKADLLYRLKQAQIKSDIDMEAGHSDADDALINFIDDPEITEAYDDVEKVYAWNFVVNQKPK